MSDAPAMVCAYGLADLCSFHVNLGHTLPSISSTRAGGVADNHCLGGLLGWAVRWGGAHHGSAEACIPPAAVTARKDDAPATDQAAITNVLAVTTLSGGGGLIQTTSG